MVIEEDWQIVRQILEILLGVGEAEEAVALRGVEVVREGRQLVRRQRRIAAAPPVVGRMVKGFGIDRAAVQAQVLGVPPGQVQLAGMVIGVVLRIVLGPRMGLAYQLPVLPVTVMGRRRQKAKSKPPVSGL